MLHVYCNDEIKFLDSEEFDFRFNCGVTQPGFNAKLTDKGDIISALCRHYTLYCTAAELEHFRNGLSALNFKTLMTEYPDVVRPASAEQSYCKFHPRFPRSRILTQGFKFKNS